MEPQETEAISVVWTKHAIQRAGSRFGFDEKIRIPNRLFIKQALRVQDGQQFKIRSRGIVYVCVLEKTVVKIITVHRDNRQDTLEAISYGV